MIGHWLVTSRFHLEFYIVMKQSSIFDFLMRFGHFVANLVQYDFVGHSAMKNMFWAVAFFIVNFGYMFQCYVCWDETCVSLENSPSIQVFGASIRELLFSIYVNYFAINCCWCLSVHDFGKKPFRTFVNVTSLSIHMTVSCVVYKFVNVDFWWHWESRALRFLVICKLDSKRKSTYLTSALTLLVGVLFCD